MIGQGYVEHKYHGSSLGKSLKFFPSKNSFNLTILPHTIKMPPNHPKFSNKSLEKVWEEVREYMKADIDWEFPPLNVLFALRPLVRAGMEFETILSEFCKLQASERHGLFFLCSLSIVAHRYSYPMYQNQIWYMCRAPSTITTPPSHPQTKTIKGTHGLRKIPWHSQPKTSTTSLTKSVFNLRHDGGAWVGGEFLARII